MTYDFEYVSIDGERPKPVCLVWHDWESGETHRIWQDELLKMKKPPFDISEKTICCTYYYGAEGSCHQVLGWEHPTHVIDCSAEFRNRTNGAKVPCGKSLIGAMIFYGLPTMTGEKKDSMRDLILSGGPWSILEKEAILKYCEADVSALNDLVLAMASDIDRDYALYRGRYSVCLSEIEDRGIPIDKENLGKIRKVWPELLKKLTVEVDKEYGCFEGSVFKQNLFAEYLIRNQIEWPRTATGKLDLKDDTFKEKAIQYPELENMRQLRSTLSKTRNLQLTVGADGRNRCMLSPFASKTGRNQPSNAKFVFGPAKWVRFLIKPEEGMALAYVDYSQQEFGIAAALSGDKAMQEAYKSGDAYITFAKQSGAVPDDATPQSHPRERAQFKTCALGTLYGLRPEGMAEKLNQPVETGRQLLRHHQNCYPDFWQWSHDTVTTAILLREMQTVMGWKMKVPPRINAQEGPNMRSLANFPMQANGSEMLRVAVIKAHYLGVEICATVHDALLIQAPLNLIDKAAIDTQQAMVEASELILKGFRLKTDTKVFKWPDRYFDESGAGMWLKIMKLLH
ncbi:MAG: DNA polymerase [SAR324 cluster bacterium]|nr:DNA polymerase [SAR324 cluster bacterium]